MWICKCFLECYIKISVFTNLISFAFIFTINMLLIILFKIELYARNNTFKYVKKKHRQDVIKRVKSYESFTAKYMKVKADITSVKSWNKENPYNNICQG